MTILNTPEERHAFMIGFCELIPPWPPTYFLALPSREHLQTEHHYYLAGRTCGVVGLIVLAFLVKKLFWG